MASLSNQLSVLGAAGGGGSVTSANQISALSQAVSVHSNLISNAISARAVLSNQVSAISAGLGGVQKRVVTGAQVVSATSFTNVSGLSLTLVAGANYQIDGRVAFTLSILTGTQFGFTYPGNNQVSTGTMEMECLFTVMNTAANLASTNYARGRITNTQMSTAATANISVPGISATTLQLNIAGLINVNSAATLQLQTKASAAGGGINILPGSWLRAFKVT